MHDPISSSPAGVAGRGAAPIRIGPAAPPPGRFLPDSLTFGFVHLGVPFVATVETHGAGASLRLTGELGHVPYSAESGPGRRHVLALFHDHRTFPHGRLELEAAQTIRLYGAVPLTARPGAVDVVAGVVSILLGARDCLRRFTEYLPPPAATLTTGVTRDA